MPYAKVCSCARPVTENFPHTQELAVASVLSPLSIVISGALSNEFSTYLPSLYTSKYLCHREFARVD